MKKYILVVMLIVSYLSSSSQEIFYAPTYDKYSKLLPKTDDKVNYNIYLLGDIKTNKNGIENLMLLKSKLKQESENSAVILLGDIIYPFGLPNKDSKDFEKAENSLKTILNIFKNYKGKVFIIPGNHDWARGGKNGYENLLNLEKYIQNYNGHEISFIPQNCCPGPVEVALSTDITLIIFDSQWWFHTNSKPSSSNCGIKTEEEIFVKIDDIIKRNKDKKIVVAAHHPLYSIGEHGGYFPLKTNLFPLLALSKYLYIPLPGFIYTGYRKYFGDIQDFAHPKYKSFRSALLNIFKKYPNIIYASGHEHNMQYLEKDKLFHIVSGSCGNGSYISKNSKKANFAYENAGFCKLDFYKSGQVAVKFIIPNNNISGKVLFNKIMFQKPLFNPEHQRKILNSYYFPKDSIFANASDKYADPSRLHTFLLGKNYRNLWVKKIKLPVFDIGKEKGGLTILKKGGGMQTTSIRLEDKNKKQYTLRSVDKNIEKVLPKLMRNTLFQKPVQDIISASHPYAAVTLPPLEEAAGILHTNPQFVFVPDDPRLGIYKEDLANKVFLFEERPNGNWKDAGHFGFSEKIVSTPKMLKKIYKKQNHMVDQKAVLKARLFDMFINDWDRHDDQWRWATKKTGDKTIYLPIPRDRDQAYFTNQGLLMWFVSIKWVLGKYQGLDYPIKVVKGLNYNARHFDRSFLTELSLDDWKQIVNELKQSITDSVIHKGLLKMPKEIYDLSGKEIEEKLKVRRDSMHVYAEEYYKILAQKVDVTGTKKNELFVVKRLKNGDTDVEVFALNEDNDIDYKMYSRVFKNKETKEIRLYGMDGKDIFKINGDADKGITLRIIGGKGKDTFIDSSKVTGFSNKTIIYDRKDKHNKIIKSKETKLNLSSNKSVNKYDRLQFKYNLARMFFSTGYNIDDGIFIGGGINIKRFNFRDSILHRIQGDLAFLTGAFSIGYNGYYSSTSKLFDFKIDAELSFPRNVDNFYGLGNESKRTTEDKKYYRLRYKYGFLNPMIHKEVNNNFNYSIGLFYQYYEVTDTSGRFIGNQSISNLSNESFDVHNYTGINTKISYDTRDNTLFPRRGIKWISEMGGYYNLNNNEEMFLKLQSELSMFLSFRNDPRIVFAFRFGAAKNYGEYEFFHANFLGRKTNLRGFRNNRFAGDSYVFQNTEIRIKLKNIRSYLLNGAVGINIFNDSGKVWYSSINSSKWHNGYGVELWMIPFDFTILSLSYSTSEEDEMVNFNFSYLF